MTDPDRKARELCACVICDRHLGEVGPCSKRDRIAAALREAAAPTGGVFTYEFFLHPEQSRWPFRFRELWTHEEFEEAWRRLEARGIEMREVERYRQEPLYGWPKPEPTGRDAGAEYRAKHPDAAGELLAWLRGEP